MKYILELIVFLCGASLMILELVGSRLLAPYIGTSTIVWTSLIGIILAFLSLGYFWGGRMADQGATFKKLATVIMASAFFVFIIIFINEPILAFIMVNIKNIYAGAVIATLVLFSVPGFLLGIISPYAIRLKIKSLEETGRTAGSLYAISTIGSIVGTFSAGFLLIPFLGTIRILYFITFVLIISSFLAYLKVPSKTKTFFLFFLFLIILLSISQSINIESGRLIDIDTQYNRIWIRKGFKEDVGRPILAMTTDPHGTQSGMFLDGDDDLVFEYSKYYRLADHFNPGFKSSLLIGGAAYAYPKDFLKRNKEATIDVVEIDSGMTRLARDHFNLKDDPRLTIYHQDGRVFLNNNEKKYDVIFLDAFNSKLSIPYQLATREAAERVYESLSDDGVVFLNLISSLAGKKSKFLRAEYLTYKQVFPEILLFKVKDTALEEAQNFILVAFKNERKVSLVSENKEFDRYLKALWRGEIKEDLPILTDDYAPVDYYTMVMF